MATETVLLALIAVWPKLPELIGPAWPEVFARVAFYVAALREVHDPVERARLTRELWLTFRDYPAARPHLQQALVAASADRTQRQALPNELELHTAPGPIWSDLLVQLRQRVNSTRCRYANVCLAEGDDRAVVPRTQPLAMGRRYSLRFDIGPLSLDSVSRTPSRTHFRLTCCHGSSRATGSTLWL